MKDGAANEPFDIDARMEQVVGKEPRVAPLSQNELSGEQLALIERVRRGAGSAAQEDMPEFFLTVVKHPRLFACQLEAGTLYFTGTIPPRERELAILRVGWMCRAPYEWGEHVTIGKRCGLTDAEVARVKEGSEAPGWDEHDAAVIKGVEELLGDKMVSDATWAVLAKSWTEQQLLEYPMLVGAYVATAFQQNSLRMRLMAGNEGLRQA